MTQRNTVPKQAAADPLGMLEHLTAFMLSEFVHSGSASDQFQPPS